MLVLVSACGGTSGGDGDASGDTSTGSQDTSSATAMPTATTDDPSTSSAPSTTADSSGSDTTDTGDVPSSWEGIGPNAVGHTTTTIMLVDDRTAAVQWWYPATAEGPAASLVDLEIDARGEVLAGLVADAPEPCTRKTLGSSPDLEPVAGDVLPVVVFSHCNDCTRYSSSTIAEALASWGFVVAAVDHTDNTLFDAEAGTSVGVSPAFLEVRGDDIGRVIDAVVDGGDAVPDVLEGRLDGDTIGMMGHSFGSVTAGWVAERDDRVDAAVGIAAPMENPLLPGVTITGIDVPLLMLLAQEDNSILEIGNNLLRSNFDDANAPAWIVEFVDAGHWSFSDICALVDGFSPGCGDDERQTVPGEPFTYVDIDQTRRRAADWIVTFYAAHLLGDADASAWLAAPPADAAITVMQK